MNEGLMGVYVAGMYKVLKGVFDGHRPANYK